MIVHSAPWALVRPDGRCAILCGVDPTSPVLRNGHTPDQDLDQLYGRGRRPQGCTGCAHVYERLGLPVHASWKRHRLHASDAGWLGWDPKAKAFLHKWDGGPAPDVIEVVLERDRLGPSRARTLVMHFAFACARSRVHYYTLDPRSCRSFPRGTYLSLVTA